MQIFRVHPLRSPLCRHLVCATKPIFDGRWPEINHRAWRPQFRIQRKIGAFWKCDFRPALTERSLES